MVHHAIIDPKTNEVINVVIWEGAEWLPPRGYYVVQDDLAQIGDKYDFERKKLIKLDRTAKDSS